MVHFISQDGDISYGIAELIADKRKDVEGIPNKMPKDCAPGSSCVVIEDSSVWLLGSDGWQEVK